MLLRGERAPLEWDREGFRLPVIRHALHAGDETAVIVLHVVVLHVGGDHLEADGYAVADVAVVEEMLSRLDVVLVSVGPVQVDLLAVVRDGILLAPGVAPPGEEVSTIVVAAEEGEEVVEDRGFQVLLVRRVTSLQAQSKSHGSFRSDSLETLWRTPRSSPSPDRLSAHQETVLDTRDVVPYLSTISA